MKAEILADNQTGTTSSRARQTFLTPQLVTAVIIAVCAIVIIVAIYRAKTTGNVASVSGAQSRLAATQNLQVKPLSNPSTTDTATKNTNLQAFNENSAAGIGASSVTSTSLGATNTPSLNTNTTANPLGL